MKPIDQPRIVEFNFTTFKMFAVKYTTGTQVNVSLSIFFGTKFELQQTENMAIISYN